MKKILAAAATAALLPLLPAPPWPTPRSRWACSPATWKAASASSSARPRTWNCSFKRSGHKAEHYSGNIKKLGIDIGVTGQTEIVWLVFSGSSTKYGPGSLAGTYVGGSG
ncbi:MAG: DUF992 domain-containing protein [Paludibaculum sp.]